VCEEVRRTGPVCTTMPYFGSTSFLDNCKDDMRQIKLRGSEQKLCMRECADQALVCMTIPQIGSTRSSEDSYMGNF
jgi:hypothetical protein